MIKNNRNKRAILRDRKRESKYGITIPLFSPLTGWDLYVVKSVYGSMYGRYELKGSTFSRDSVSSYPNA